MRTLVISDLHIGDPRCEDTSVVINTLKKEKYDQIVLNGDIVDLWLVKPDGLCNKPVIRLLAQIAKSKKVIWVLGNHDWEARGQNIIPGALEVDSFQITDRKKVLCIHGHQVYEFQNMSWHSKQLFKINSWIWKLTGFDIQRFFNVGFLYEWVVKRRRKSVLERYGKTIDTIIIGHTHLVGYSSINKSQLYDIGSLAIRRTYAIVENGHVELRKA